MGWLTEYAERKFLEYAVRAPAFPQKVIHDELAKLENNMNAQRENFERMEAAREGSASLSVCLNALMEIARIAHPESKSFEIANVALAKYARYSTVKPTPTPNAPLDRFMVFLVPKNKTPKKIGAYQNRIEADYAAAVLRAEHPGAFVNVVDTCPRCIDAEEAYRP